MKHLPILVLLLCAGSAHADLYKWVDENGKVHYSDQPAPPSVTKQETIRAPKPAATATAPDSGGEGEPQAKPVGPKSAAEQEMDFRKRRLEASEAEAKAKKDAETLAEKKRSCEKATNQVRVLETGGRITRYTPAGEQVYMNDAEIAHELIDARKAADSWCK